MHKPGIFIHISMYLETNENAHTNTVFITTKPLKNSHPEVEGDTAALPSQLYKSEFLYNNVLVSETYWMTVFLSCLRESKCPAIISHSTGVLSQFFTYSN